MKKFKKLLSMTLALAFIATMAIGLGALTAGAAEQEPAPVACTTCNTDGANYDANGFCYNVQGTTHYQAATLNTSGTDDTADDYYEIGNAGQLYWFAAQVNGGNNTINGKLTENIDLNPGYTFTFEADTGLVKVSKTEGATTTVVAYLGTGIAGSAVTNGNVQFDTTASVAGTVYAYADSTYTESANAPDALRMWMPIGVNYAYEGVFDGDGNTVKGIYINTNNNSQGMFSHIGYNGKVQSLSVANSYVKSFEYVGGVVGNNSGTVQSCENSGIVIGNNSVGGVVGENSNNVIKSSNGGTVSGNDQVGGVVGNNNGAVQSCENSGTVIGNNRVGGVVGLNHSHVASCSNTGAVIGTGDYVGGVVGLNHSHVASCSNTGAVIGTGNYVGGVVGENQNYVIKSSNGGTVSGNDQVGGVVGQNSGTVEDCYNTADVSGNDQVGGVVGRNDNTVKNSYSIGGVSGNYQVGGVVGWSSTTVTGTYFLQTDTVNATIKGNSNASADQTQTSAKTATQFASGEVTWLLNESSANEIVWYQTIGKDGAPTLDSTKGVVYGDYALVYAQAQLDSAVADIQGEGYHNETIASLVKALEEARAALAKSDADNKTALEAKDAELAQANADSKAALDAKDAELAKADADNKAALEAKNASQQTFIVIVCVIAGLAFAGCGTLGVLFFLDKKKKA